MKQRHREIFEDLVRDHAAELHRFAFWQTGDPEVAEDLVQESYYEAWRSIRTLRQPETARAWIFQILRHRYAHWLRTNRRRPQILMDPADLERAEGDDLRGRHALDVLENRDALESAFARLEDRYKEPFLLVFLEGLTCREAAELLDVPLGTVLSRIHRARRRRRSFLAGVAYGAGADADSSDAPRLKLLRSGEDDGS
jgi:RNA polymerase sigma-70 factor (ECF subfamily)